jgi:hypothetical protein
MKKVLTFLFLYGSAVFAQVCNNCINFQVSSGTGCEWMCNYCATNLNTSNYYFNPPVCTYQQGGCVGNPMTGVTYSCCSI